jgi:hypothetical protein
MIAKLPAGHKSVPIAGLPAPLARMLLTIIVVAASIAVAILIG